jgi:hypothetical protein
VPRPAMLVETVIDPFLPACATTYASFSWCLALRTACLIFFFSRKRAIAVLFSTLVVPTRMGCPFSCFSRISAMRAVNFSFSVL